MVAVSEQLSHVTGQTVGLATDLGNGRGLELGTPPAPPDAVDRSRGAGTGPQITVVVDVEADARRVDPRPPVGHETGDEG
jgi:hypothetical protein